MAITDRKKTSFSVDKKAHVSPMLEQQCTVLSLATVRLVPRLGEALSRYGLHSYDQM